MKQLTKHLMKMGGISMIVASLLPVSANAFGAKRAELSATLLSSGKIDLAANTITLPLRKGALKDGRSVWFILTDTSDKNQAKELGIVYAPSLAQAAEAKSTRIATVGSDGQFIFNAGTVDFKPSQTLIPGDAPNYFPPKQATPGSLGDADYSPFVRVENEGNIVFNAPILAFNVDASQINFCNGNADHNLVHDKVIKICPSTMEVTVPLSHGFANSNAVVYLSFDANDPLAATLESSTYAPAISDLSHTGAADELFAFVNGEVGSDNLQRQGFDSALHGDGSPLNILDGLPSVDNGYSPLWDVHIGAWTDQAIESGQRKLVTNSSDVFVAVKAGLVTGPGGGAYASSGILVNCPIVGILKK